ncbi:MAG: NPCBM/NEW2 domain-containing protein [Candidatus Hydrogenedentes bacterium]|nr:NPCBM/NEW2 domain-containing protein [Candidatus Hydrogenedentota bacterium]
MLVSAVAAVMFFSAADNVSLNQQWAERMFTDAVQQAPSAYVAATHEDSPGDVKYGKATAGGPLRLGDKTYEHGIGLNSHAVVHVVLPQPGKLFRADIGLDRNVDGSVASVRCRVEVDGRVLFKTDVMRPGDAPHSIEVSLDGAQSFDLVVDNGDDGRDFDQANWANARVQLADGSEQFVDELPRRDEGSTWPFSFVYGGQHSAELLPSWDRRIEVKKDDQVERRTLIFSDPKTKLEVRAVVSVYADTPGVDWTLHFANRGTTDAPPLENVRALDASFACDAAPVTFRSLRSTGGADDWLPFSAPLALGQTHAFAPNAGRSSSGACPFFDVQWKGGGVVAGIGWTGQWTASVENSGNAVRLRAGMQNLHLALRPGESIRTPRILLMRWDGGDDALACNLWRDTMRRHISPRANGEIVVPPIAHLSTAFYEMDACTEALALDHLNAGKDLGFECFWYDAYYGKANFPTVGNYVLPVLRGFNTTRFPNGLKPLADAAHAAGLQFLMWFEPERICPGTLMAVEHPEWVVLPDGGGWGMFNLAVPEARQYITDYMNRLIDDYGIDWVRIDNAVQYTPLWQKLDAAAGPDRVGIAEIRYVEGLYQWWDDMRAAHPGMAIDNCASGGGRIDLETCARAIPLWRTDGTITPLMNRDYLQAALQNQVMTAGLSRYVPFSVSGQMGADPYCFRSGFNAGISFCEDTRPADYPRDLLRAGIAEGKRIRKYFFGNLYALNEVTTNPTDWCALQYHRAAENDGMILAFRRHRSPYTALKCALHEIDADAEYEVVFSPGYSPNPSVKMKGADLQAIELKIDEMPGSLLVEYRKLTKL